jgi:mannose-6-phosphate isomerase-like protein (cupin superfamily)
MVETDVPTPFKVAKIHPQMVSRGKKGASLFRTDILGATVQVVTEGGETNLHAHAGSDATWLVVAGQATFYGEGDKLVARLDKNEMLLIREARHIGLKAAAKSLWSSCVSARELRTLRINALTTPSARQNHGKSFPVSITRVRNSQESPPRRGGAGLSHHRGHEGHEVEES